MASLRSLKLLQKQANKLHSIGVRNTWLIVQNNSGYDLKAHVTTPDKKSDSSCTPIPDGKENSWALDIGQYKVWFSQGGGGDCQTGFPHPASAWFLVNKINDDDCIIKVGHHVHYHITNGSEDALPVAVP
eukprot:837844_1